MQYLSNKLTGSKRLSMNLRPPHGFTLSALSRLALLGGVLALTTVLFLFLNLQGVISYVLPRRAWMMLTIIIVGVSAGIATVLFHTISHNRILTPAIMGFESLYILIQTSMIFILGAENSLSDSRVWRFAFECSLMMGFVIILYRSLFARSGDLHRLLLVGIVFGVLFFSLANLMQRMLEPSEFDFLQSRLFARLTLPHEHLIMLCLLTLGIVCLVVWRMRYVLDVMALGKTQSVTLGINYQRKVTQILLLVAVLVAMSTALIGPLTFLGFLAATIAYQLAGTHQHRILLPMAAGLGVFFLLSGQLILEHILGMAGVLTVVIEFVGGAIFLTILLRKKRL